jgi:hypothetical protein
MGDVRLAIRASRDHVRAGRVQVLTMTARVAEPAERPREVYVSF